MEKRKVRVYIAASLDGYIAHSDGNIDWLESVARPDEDYGYAAFIKTIDTVIMGRKTYEKVLSFGGEFPRLLQLLNRKIPINRVIYAFMGIFLFFGM